MKQEKTLNENIIILPLSLCSENEMSLRATTTVESLDGSLFVVFGLLLFLSTVSPRSRLWNEHKPMPVTTPTPTPGQLGSACLGRSGWSCLFTGMVCSRNSLFHQFGSHACPWAHHGRSWEWPGNVCSWPN